MSSELIRITQLPVIEERLRSLKESFDKQTEEALSLVCSEDMVQVVKAVRANLRKQFDDLEDQRKAVKSAVFAPYDQFEAVYRECVSDAFKTADAALKGKIDAVEGEIKRRCEDGLREYFAELCAAHDIDWLKYEQAGIKVDMASAKQKTPKKLREQLVEFVARVSLDVDTIADMDNAEELLVEYKVRLKLSEAFSAVQDRHRRIEAERQYMEQSAARKAAEAEAVRKVEALAPPAVQETKTVTFTVTDTVDRLIALREWMKANNYKYQ